MSARGEREGREEAYSLVEICVVLTIVVVLRAIAIPLFLGAKDKSDERGAQAHVRTAFTNERLEFTEREAYADATVMARAEPSLRWTAEQLSAASPEKSVYVDVLDGGRAVVLASRSEGTCFYLRNAATGDAKGTFYADQTVDSGDCIFAPAAVDDARW